MCFLETKIVRELWGRNEFPMTNLRGHKTKKQVWTRNLNSNREGEWILNQFKQKLLASSNSNEMSQPLKFDAKPLKFDTKVKMSIQIGGKRELQWKERANAGYETKAVKLMLIAMDWINHLFCSRCHNGVRFIALMFDSRYCIVTGNCTPGKYWGRWFGRFWRQQ